jgi:N-acetylglutamate synthase-like GNAT family acetyltransferase
MNLAVRQAEASDVPAIRALLADAGLPVADVGAQTAAWFVLAMEGGALIGTAAVEPCGSFGLLRSLAVRPDRRGRGVGQRLVAECESRADAAKLRGLYLLTTTARHYLAALGYDELERWELPESVRETEQYRTLCPKTAVAMMKRLR